MRIGMAVESLVYVERTINIEERYVNSVPFNYNVCMKAAKKALDNLEDPSLYFGDGSDLSEEDTVAFFELFDELMERNSIKFFEPRSKHQ